MSDSSDAYITGLWERYRKAMADEESLMKRRQKLARHMDRLRDETNEARGRKARYAQSLRDEGIEPETEAASTQQPESKPVEDKPLLTLAGTNGHSDKPLSNTHALYIIMRKHGNAGFTEEQLEQYSREEGFNLSVDVIKSVVWRQMGKKLMARGEDGLIRLTAEGEKFTNFRKQKGEEFKQAAVEA